MPSEANVSVLGANNRAFAFDLYHQLASAQPDKNLLFSPYSISTALAMAYAGARGTTASEMKATLHFELEDAPLHEAFNATDLRLRSRAQGQAGAAGTPFQLNVDNALWTQADGLIEPQFLDTLAVNYDAGAFSLDFLSDPEGSRQTINRWVDDRTHHLIAELLPASSITSLTRLVLTNTVYFDAGWQTPFTENLTADAPFTRLDSSTATVSMMRATLTIPSARGDGFQAIALPYSNSALRFIAILPDVGAHPKVEAALSGAWFDALHAGWADQQLSVSLPKLDYGAKTTLNEPMKKLGTNDAFSDATADFTGIARGPKLFISGIFHQASLRATESGTVASAATGVVIATRHATVMDAARIVFDRPFFLAIVDEPTGTILFLGRVLDPTVK